MKKKKIKKELKEIKSELKRIKKIISIYEMERVAERVINNSLPLFSPPPLPPRTGKPKKN